MPEILTPHVRGYQRRCSQCNWSVTQPDDSAGRWRADRHYDSHVAEHAPAMPTEPEVPPQRLYYKLINGNWQRVMPSPETVEYVPASALRDAWEKAIAAAIKVINDARGEGYTDLREIRERIRGLTPDARDRER